MLKLKHNTDIITFVTKLFGKKLFLLLLLSILATTSVFAQNYFDKAVKAHQDDDYVTAIQNLDSDLQLNPKHSDGYMLRASCKYYLEDFNDALSDIIQAIKFFDKKTSIYQESLLYCIRGNIYYAIEEFGEAIKNYSEAIKKEPTQVEYLKRRAKCYTTMEDYAKSDADYKKAIEIDNTCMDAKLGLVDNMIVRKEYSEAINTLNKLEKIDQRNHMIFYKRSWIYGRQNEYKKAIDDIIQSMYYGDIDEYNSFYLCSYSAHHLEYTVAKIKAKILIDNNNKFQWQNLLASVYESNKKYNNAIDVYNEIEHEFGSRLRVYYYRGLMYNNTGAYDKAITDFDAGLKQNPDAEKFYKARAETYNAQGKFDYAINDLNKILKLKPMDYSAYFGRAWTKWMYKKDYQGAIEDISMAIAIDDESAHAYFIRARLYGKMNKPNLAENDLKKVIELDSSEYRIYALIFQGNHQQAYSLIDKTIQKDSTNYYDYACIYSLLNNQQKSVFYLKKTLDDGWRDFVHLEYDPDLDNIRNSVEYNALLNEYKQKLKDELALFEISESQNDFNRNKEVYVIPVKKLKSNLYEVICAVNGVPMKFVFDTGASGVLLSRTEADFLIKNDYLKSYDIGKKIKSRIANGNIVESTSVKLRKFKIGDLELEDIDASIMDNPDVDLLLGQSVLQKFGKVEVDNEKSVMIITVIK